MPSGREFTITCPYCFGKMKDDEVLFRSERVSSASAQILPRGYHTLEEFEMDYEGSDKNKIIRKYNDWVFFREEESPLYHAFWEHFGGTTEVDPAESILKVKPYNRKILNPNSVTDQAYLVKQLDDSYLVRDDDGMVSKIILKEDTENGQFTMECSRRVCKHCHNPLPSNYGKYPVKFATVIGITSSGKTVYLSQMLRKMSTYAARVGLDAVVDNDGIPNFLQNNPVSIKNNVPGSTPASSFQQPLCYEIQRSGEDGHLITETLVLYDVAGETMVKPALVARFAPFVEHANGIIVLIDPRQFDVMGMANQVDDPDLVLQNIHNIIPKDRETRKALIPVAICISKVDTPEIQEILNDSLKDALLNDVAPLVDNDGNYRRIFNERDYIRIGRELKQFFQSNATSLVSHVNMNYVNHAYFAFTALGCDVKEGKPIGPIVPKRIEEPLLWLFYKFGYIGTNVVRCPKCSSPNLERLQERDRKRVEGRLFNRVVYYDTYCCSNCGHRW